MKLFNTATKQIEQIEPIATPTVSVYTCGPTVYDYPHIGNWFTFLRYDLLIRVLQLENLKPKWVLNITDVGHLVSDADEGEDKLEKGAKREGKSAWDIANFYTTYFLNSLKKLNFVQPQYLPRATDHINDQIELIKTLEEKGYTYIIDDGVYYDTSKFPDYGKLAQLDVDEQQPGKRVQFNPQKKNPADFALWKLSPPDKHRDMEWDSPWGKGFPGWHIECSAMALKYLGETIDLHAGGIDHLPVHHTNEIAQSEAATGKPFSHYWMHSNHVLVDNEKIAKSTGNGITLEDVENKGYSLEALRLLVLQSHYRSQSHFSWQILDDAAKSLKNLRANFSWLLHVPHSNADPLTEASDLFASYKQKISNILLNDLNTPEALAALHEAGAKFSALPATEADIQALKDFSAFINERMGINILIETNLTDQQHSLLRQREEARKKSNWELSDKLRAELQESGIAVKDTPSGTTWYPL